LLRVRKEVVSLTRVSNKAIADSESPIDVSAVTDSISFNILQILSSMIIGSTLLDS
jgi:hypothetical protein